MLFSKECDVFSLSLTRCDNRGKQPGWVNFLTQDSWWHCYTVFQFSFLAFLYFLLSLQSCAREQWTMFPSLQQGGCQICFLWGFLLCTTGRGVYSVRQQCHTISARNHSPQTERVLFSCFFLMMLWRSAICCLNGCKIHLRVAVDHRNETSILLWVCILNVGSLKHKLSPPILSQILFSGMVLLCQVSLFSFWYWLRNCLTTSGRFVTLPEDVSLKCIFVVIIKNTVCHFNCNLSKQYLLSLFWFFHLTFKLNS